MQNKFHIEAKGKQQTDLTIKLSLSQRIYFPTLHMHKEKKEREEETEEKKTKQFHIKEKGKTVKHNETQTSNCH